MITDIGMPNMNGWQLIEQIQGKYPEMKVVVLTGWGDSSSSELQKKFKIDYYLDKLVEIEQIRQLIVRVLKLNTFD